MSEHDKFFRNKRYNWTYHAYCFMTKHYHPLIPRMATFDKQDCEREELK